MKPVRCCLLSFTPLQYHSTVHVGTLYGLVRGEFHVPDLRCVLPSCAPALICDSSAYDVLDIWAVFQDVHFFSACVMPDGVGVRVITLQTVPYGHCTNHPTLSAAEGTSAFEHETTLVCMCVRVRVATRNSRSHKLANRTSRNTVGVLIM